MGAWASRPRAKLAPAEDVRDAPYFLRQLKCGILQPPATRGCTGTLKHSMIDWQTSARVQKIGSTGSAVIELVVDNGTGGVCRGPTLAGWPLRAFEWVLATPLGVPVLRAMLRDSGVPQVLAQRLASSRMAGAYCSALQLVRFIMCVEPGIGKPRSFCPQQGGAHPPCAARMRKCSITHLPTCCGSDVQAVSDIDVPEAPTFVPRWPALPVSHEDDVVIQEMSVSERVAAVAATIPGKLMESIIVTCTPHHSPHNNVQHDTCCAPNLFIV